jgi:hypothetical protein
MSDDFFRKASLVPQLPAAGGGSGDYEENQLKENRIESLMNYKLELIRILSGSPARASVGTIKREIQETNSVLGALSSEFGEYTPSFFRKVFG